MPQSQLITITTAIKRDITSFPPHILSDIADWLDLPSARSMSLVCRDFYPYAHVRVMRDLSLFFGPKTPLRFKYYADDLTLKVAPMSKKTAMTVASEGYIGRFYHEPYQIEGVINITTMPISVQSAIKGIRCLDPAANLLKVRIVIDFLRRHSMGIDYSDPLVNPPGLIFQSLTKLVLSSSDHTSFGVRGCYAEHVALLCNSSPSLESLDITIINHPTPSWIPLTLPLLSQDTKISHLRISSQSSHDEIYVSEAARLLIKHSPALRKLIIDGYFGDPHPPTTLSTIGQLQKLEIMAWMADPITLLNYPRSVLPTFPSMLSMVILLDDNISLLEVIPTLPEIQAIYFESTFCKDYRAPYFPGRQSTSAINISGHLVAQLSGSPKLQYLHFMVPGKALRRGHLTLDFFDEIATIGIPPRKSGSIRSIRHHQSELFHLRLPIESPAVTEKILHQTMHIANAGVHNRFVDTDFELMSEVAFHAFHHWQDLTDLDGCVVPLDVIAKMLEVDEIKMEDWQGRNMEVTDKAWGVITEWKERPTITGEPSELSRSRTMIYERYRCIDGCDDCNEGQDYYMELARLLNLHQ